MKTVAFAKRRPGRNMRKHTNPRAKATNPGPNYQKPPVSKPLLVSARKELKVLPQEKNAVKAILESFKDWAQLRDSMDADDFALEEGYSPYHFRRLGQGDPDLAVLYWTARAIINSKHKKQLWRGETGPTHL